MNKLFSIFVLVAALFLQSCASSAPRSASADDGYWSRPNFACAQGCKRKEAITIYWDQYDKKYDNLRSRGGRLDSEGKPLTPVAGKPGVFQNENGYRVVHEVTCNKENAFMTFFGAFLTIGGSQLPNVYARVGTVGLTGAAQNSFGRARSYKCAELKEKLDAGNVIFQQLNNEQLAVQSTEQTNTFSMEQDVRPLEDVVQNHSAPASVVAQQAVVIGSTEWCYTEAALNYGGVEHFVKRCQGIGRSWGAVTTPQGKKGCGCQ